MKSVATEQFWRCLESLPASVQRQANDAFGLWRSNPRHASLQFKRIAGRREIVSVRVGLRWRAIGTIDGDTVIWFWIGSHADYDELVTRRR